MVNTTNVKKRGLGKGLAELGINELLSDMQQTETATVSTESFKKIPIHIIQSGRYQPRRDFKSEALQELADSIRSQGIIQPLVVRAIAKNQYEIIAGERRWRAAQLANLTEVPVIIREISDEAAMAMALIENIQREDLNPLEEATALQRLIDEFSMTHQQVAQVVGKARATVTNLLRLLQLNADVKILLEKNKMELGHAKVLLTLSGNIQSDIAKQIVNKQLSVRETENLIQQLQNPQKKSLSQAKKLDPNIAKLQRKLADILGASINIQHQNNGKGQLVIRYNSLAELEGIIEYLES